MIVKNFILWLLIIALSYLLLEISYSTLYVNGWIAPSQPYWILEDSGKIVHFDAISGVRLTPIPTRVAKFSHGEMEFQMIMHGNNAGFPDRNDFNAYIDEPGVIRIAVLGDSFSAAQYLERDWTEMVEALAQQVGLSVEMLNFSVSGGGLANWWSVVTRLLDAQDYQLDGLIFAVYEEDLQRRFYFSDHRGYQRHRFAYASSWEPEQWPATLAQAQPYLKPSRGFILDPPVYEQALTGDWLPADSPPPWRAYALLHLRKLLKTSYSNLVSIERPVLNPAQQRLIGDIASYAKARSLPVMVASIPSRESLLNGTAMGEDIKQFAELLNASLIDGYQLFVDLTEQEIRERWLPYDGHWGQLGSDEFAVHVWQAMQSWSVLKR